MSNDLSELFGAHPKKSTMEKIPQPSQKDVLCGRGGGTLRHIGNRKYRSLIKLNKPVYLISTKEQKSAISRSIVDVIRNNGGRFLEKATNRNWYHDIGDAKAMEKTSQALREGQSKLRKRLIHSAMNLDNTSSDHNININIRTAGAFDAMFMSPPALADSPTRNHVNAMMHPPSALRRSLDSLIASESELLRRELPPRPYYSRSSSNNNNNNNNISHPRRADIIVNNNNNNNNNNNRSPPRSRNILFGPRVGQMDPTHAHRLGSVMVTPPFSPKRTVQPSERLVDMFPRPTLYGDPDRGQTRQEHETPIIDFLNDANANAADDDANDYDYDNDANDYDNNANNANDDDNNANNANNDDDNDDANDEDDSIMTFDLDDEELDDEELFRDNDDSEEMMMTSSVPTWPVTNHPTALNNLNTNENLSAVSLDSYSVQRQEQQHRRRQQQQQQQQFRHRESDGNTELHVRRKYSSQDEVEFTDHENEDSGYISLGMLAPMFRKEANYHSIRLAI